MATRKPGKIRGARQRKRFRPRAWSRELGFVEEPLLEFAHGQTAEHPRDGLYLYGPVAGQAGPVPIDYGVIGTEEGLARFDGWAKEVSLAIPRHVPKLNPDALHHITFPGFEAAFNTRWPVQPAARITVDSTKVEEMILIGNRAEGIKKTVDLFVEPLVAFADRQEVAPKFWFVIVPELIYRYGRPNQVVPKALRTQGTINISRARAQEALAAPSLFPEHDEGADIYEYGLDFRRQLKARLLAPRIVTQLIRETTIAPVASRPV